MRQLEEEAHDGRLMGAEGYLYRARDGRSYYVGNEIGQIVLLSLER